ncbi:TPR-like protein [Dothidotthia symphoricarpi CBS 119687]|uniref:TPR-like protein n=1 Tax=Dothidotthia symphoricarpi CBS 119687 TaxID=1392245 RepID=A0A6A6AS01_9PLEO|nr:TPR-like protein [Dothidotthia symphoricarpi CBS 119687]KAF2133627.1 TPR-like protein [Dothidotthia symphoricarpi CBS 119687]
MLHLAAGRHVTEVAPRCLCCHCPPPYFEPIPLEPASSKYSMDPLTAFGLAANILAVVQITAELLTRINEFRSTAEGLPRGFQSLQKELPILTLSLKRIDLAIKDGLVPDDSTEALNPIIEDCKEQIKALKDIIDKVLPKKNATTVARVTKAVTSFRYDGEVKHREEVIRGYVAMLTLERVVSSSSRDLVVLRPPPTPTFVCPFGQDADFVERAVLADILSKTGPGSRQALVGGGGIGKSLLAIEYGFRVRKTSPETWVFWVDAENSAKFEAGYREIAKAVQITEATTKNADIFKLVYEWLRNEQNGSWVLIIDNADDKTVFTDYLPNREGSDVGKQLRDYLPQSSNGSILVTSRSRDAAFQVTCNYRHITTVEPMTEDEARSMLQNHLEGNHSESDMKLLIETLGYIPLPISQAAANISRRSLPITEYLKELRDSDERSASLLDESTPELRRDARRSNSIVATWSVTFEYVRKTAPSAARLLSLMCLFDRQDIPEALLQGQYGEEVNAPLPKTRKTWWRRRPRMRRTKKQPLYVKSLPSNFEDDMLMLRDFSLIKLNNDRHHFSMHPLVQFITKKWLVKYNELNVWSHVFISILNINFPNPDKGQFAKCEPLLAHAYAAIPYRPSDTSTQSLSNWASVTTRVASYYYQRTVFDTAQKMYRIAFEAFEISLGPSAPETLEANTERGIILFHMGEEAEAEKIHRRVLMLKKHALGPDHPSTLDTMDHLGDSLRFLKRTSEAEPLHIQALDARLRTLGPAHPSTQKALDKRGTFLVGQDRFAEAHTVWKQAYTASSKGIGDENHSKWCNELNLIGAKLFLEGRYKDAESYFREAMTEIERTLSPTHPQHWCLQKTALYLARALHEQQKYAEAETMYRRSFTLDDAQYAADNTEALQPMSELAALLCKTGKLDEAETLGTHCLERRTSVLGPQHRDTLESAWVLGGVLEKLGRFEEALRLYQTAYEGAVEAQGESHEDTKEYLRDYTALRERVEEIEGRNKSAVAENAQLDFGCGDAMAGAEEFASRSDGAMQLGMGRLEMVGVLA